MSGIYNNQNNINVLELEGKETVEEQISCRQFSEYYMLQLAENELSAKDSFKTQSHLCYCEGCQKEYEEYLKVILLAGMLNISQETDFIPLVEVKSSAEVEGEKVARENRLKAALNARLGIALPLNV